MELTIGTQVTHPDDPETVGVVERIVDRHTVWVRLPIPGHPGETDVLDFDPAELTRVD